MNKKLLFRFTILTGTSLFMASDCALAKLHAPVSSVGNLSRKSQAIGDSNVLFSQKNLSSILVGLDSKNSLEKSGSSSSSEESSNSSEEQSEVTESVGVDGTEGGSTEDDVNAEHSSTETSGQELEEAQQHLARKKGIFERLQGRWVSLSDKGQPLAFVFRENGELVIEFTDSTRQPIIPRKGKYALRAVNDDSFEIDLHWEGGNSIFTISRIVEENGQADLVIALLGIKLDSRPNQITDKNARRFRLEQGSLSASPPEDPESTGEASTSTPSEEPESGEQLESDHQTGEETPASPEANPQASPNDGTADPNSDSTNSTDPTERAPELQEAPEKQPANSDTSASEGTSETNSTITTPSGQNSAAEL